MLPDGEPVMPGTQVVGRGSRLHFLAGGGWYQLDVGDMQHDVSLRGDAS